MPSFELESSPVWLDVKKIIGSGSKPVTFEYRGMLHTEKQDIPVLKIMAIDFVRDYANSIGDLISIQFKMALGDYMVSLYPFRANLEFSIKTITLQEGGTSKEKNSKVVLRRYKAVFPPESNPVPTGSDLENVDTDTLNNADLVDVKLQLLDRALEPLRIKMIYGIYRDVTQKSAITAMLGGESQKILVDGKPAVDGLNLVDPDNEEVNEHMILPNGTMLVNLPTFLHEKMGGVYSTGIGTYLQNYADKKLWFVYPLFDTTRFDKTKDDKLIVYALPQDKFPGADRTYSKDGAVLKVVATSARKYNDSADVDFMNKGSGFRMADARAFMAKPVKMTKDGPVGVRTQLNHESSIEARKDGLNFAPVQVGGASANPFLQYSRITQMQTAQVDFIWENSNPELLYPGMPVKYIFLDNQKPVELKGTVVFAHTLTALQSSTGINSNIYKNITTVTILVEQVSTEQKLKSRDLPKKQVTGVW